MLNSCLTFNREKRIFEFPKVTGVTVAYCQLADDKSGFLVSATKAPQFLLWGVGTYWRNNVQYPRGLAALYGPGSVVSPFLYPKPKKTYRCLMFHITISRLQQLQYCSLSLRPELFIMGGAA